jgi:hypothetical protein
MNRTNTINKKLQSKSPAASRAPKAKPRALVKAKPVVKKGKTTVSKKPDGFASKLAKRDASKCIGPTLPTLDFQANFDRSWGVILDVVDTVIKRATIDNPQVFYYDKDRNGLELPPTVSIVQIRALWLTIAQRFLIDAGVVNPSSSKISIFKPKTMLLPIAVAKVVQQFCPYNDPATGSTARVSMTSYPTGDVFWTYPSVDKGSTGGGIPVNSLSHPRNYALSQPSLFQNTVQSFEYSILTPDNSGKPVSAITDMYSELPNMTANTLSSINTLCTMVDMTNVPPFAPDASVFSVVSRTGGFASNPFPNFNASMTAMIVPDYPVATLRPDWKVPYPFTKATPVINVFKTVGGQTPDFSAGPYRFVLMSTYAFLCSHGSWSNGEMRKLWKRSKYRDVTTLSVGGTAIDTLLICDAISQLVQQLDASSGDSQRQCYALTMLAWGAFARRISITDSIFDCVPPTGTDWTSNDYNGYTSNAAYDSILLPTSLAVMIKSLGPIVIGGRLYVPIFSEYIGSQVESLSGAGAWNPSLGTGPTGAKQGKLLLTNTSGQMTITSTIGSNPVSHDPSYRYGLNYSNYFKQLQNYLGQIAAYNYSMGTAIGPHGMGSIHVMLTSIEYEFQQSTVNQVFIGTSWIVNYNLFKTYALPSICSTQVDTDFAFACGVIGRQPGTTKVEPFKVSAAGSVNNSTILIQTAITGQPSNNAGNQNNNAYSANLQALEQAHKEPTIKMNTEGAGLTKAPNKINFSVSKIVNSSSGLLNHPSHHHSGFLEVMSHVAKALSDKALKYATEFLPPLARGVAYDGLKLVQSTISGSNILDNPIVHKLVNNVSHSSTPPHLLKFVRK